MIDFLLPVTLSNKWGDEDERIRLQRDLFAVFCPGVTIVVVAPKDELLTIKAVLSTKELRYVFLAEETILKRPHSWKWYRQQQIKLLADSFMGGSFIATLDSDIIPARPLTKEDFYTTGNWKAWVELQARHEAPWQSLEWMIYTANLIGRGQDMPSHVWPVTPCVYATEMIAHARSLFAEHNLHEKIGWSEHAVYHWAALLSGRLDHFHQGTTAVRCDFIDSIGALEKEDFFGDRHIPPFLCASSHRGFSPFYLRKKLQSLGVYG